MHYLLEQLFLKKGIETSNDLREDENQDFERWQAILSEGEITVDKIEEFCRSQISLIELQWKNLDNSVEKNEKLILLHTVYQSFLGAIHSPQRQERESLEKYLRDLL